MRRHLPGPGRAGLATPLLPAPAGLSQATAPHRGLAVVAEPTLLAARQSRHRAARAACCEPALPPLAAGLSRRCGLGTLMRSACPLFLLNIMMCNSLACLRKKCSSHKDEARASLHI